MTFPLARAESHDKLALAEYRMDHVGVKVFEVHAVAAAAVVVAEGVAPGQRGTHGDSTGAGAAGRVEEH